MGLIGLHCPQGAPMGLPHGRGCFMGPGPRMAPDPGLGEREEGVVGEVGLGLRVQPEPGWKLVGI